MKKLLLATAALILASGSAQASVTILNGGFETGSPQPALGGFSTLNAVNNSIDNWTVSLGSVDWINGYWVDAESAPNTTHSVDLSGNGNGWIEQSFLTNVGTTYTVTYFLSGNPDNPDPLDDGGRDAIIAAINGSVVSASSITGIEGFSHTNMNWKQKIFTFTAQGTETTLRFQSATNNAYGAAIDNISVSPVPEPATWALMIGGMGLAGMAVRRRRRTMNTVIA